jgi:hypothetical protein
VKEVPLPETDRPLETASFRACLATILELSIDELPPPDRDEDPATGWTLSRWVGGLGLGLARVAEPESFSWAGPWLGKVLPPAPAGARWVVMYGVPSGVVWDPAAGGEVEREWVRDGLVVAATDIALALPPRGVPSLRTGRLEAILIAPAAGEPAEAAGAARAVAGRGLEGDRHTRGAGTFPSGVPGSALTLIEAEVCESFAPSLGPDEHRRNLVTRGIELNSLVGNEFMVGSVRCRGMRLCEPCTVVQRYAPRPVLRQLVHRGGLRADILDDGEIRVGDQIRATVPAPLVGPPAPARPSRSAPLVGPPAPARPSRPAPLVGPPAPARPPAPGPREEASLDLLPYWQQIERG